MRIMIVDDNRTYLAVLRSVVSQLGELEIVVFSDPVAALAQAAATEFDLVLADYLMPEMDGVAFIRALRELPNHRHQPIVMVTTAEQREIRIAALDAGVTDFVRKPIEPVELRVRVQNLLNLRAAQTMMRDKAAWLAKEVQRATQDLLESQHDMARRLAHAIDCRDGDTGDHVARMAEICRLLAAELGLDDGACEMIFTAAPMHDIGKIGIPDAILQKPGRLTDDEMAVMRRHVSIGEAILADGQSPLMRCAEAIASTHHERWDGTGYPRGLAGHDIPIAGRIAAVADVFEALCAHRAYRPGWDPAEARVYIQSGAGTQFDPACVAAFEARWDEIAALVTASPAERPLQRAS
jgi:putative two-component system response regulator